MHFRVASAAIVGALLLVITPAAADEIYKGQASLTDSKLKGRGTSTSYCERERNLTLRVNGSTVTYSFSEEQSHADLSPDRSFKISDRRVGKGKNITRFEIAGHLGDASASGTYSVIASSVDCFYSFDIPREK
jgi:hypothetical protein